MSKNNIGQEAKDSLKEIINDLFVNDMKKINEEKHHQLKEGLEGVKREVTSKLNLTIEKVRKSSEAIEENRKKVVESIEDNKVEAVSEIEEIVGKSGNLTNEIISDGEKEIGSKIESLTNSTEAFREEYGVKLNELRVNIIEKADNDKEVQNNFINNEFKTLEEILTNHFEEIKNIQDTLNNNQIVILNKFNEGVSNIKEINDINSKRSYIFYAIIIALLLTNIFLMKV